MIRKPTHKQLLQDWEEYYRQFIADVEVDSTETEIDKIKRIQHLEANPEEWFKYYFPAYCTAEAADFHKKATKRLWLPTSDYSTYRRRWLI